MTVVMRIESLATDGLDHWSPFNGQFLKEYDPERDGRDPSGYPMSAHIVTTLDPMEAKRFPSVVELMAEWRRVCRRDPVRPDGKPNRPLTAFSVSSLTFNT